MLASRLALSSLEASVRVVDRRVGLCALCRYARVIESGRGSTFYLCGAARDDPRLTKYPRLPVLSCFAFAAEQGTPDVSARGGASSEDEP
jgi:hypothetical protein